MSKYKNLGKTRNGVKIWKFQNNRSAVDVTPMLNSFREKNEEMIYDGRICFSVTSNGVYDKAYMKKSKAKALFHTVLNGTFSKVYPNGYEEFGGFEKDGKAYARKLSFVLYKDGKGQNRIAINIEIMPGKKDQNGAYRPVGKAEKKVSSVFEPSVFVEMALETMDFIRAAEVTGLQNGTPLHTLTSLEFEPVSSKGASVQKEEKSYADMSREEFGKVYREVMAEVERRKTSK